jgi:hypothetical protein
MAYEGTFTIVGLTTTLVLQDPATQVVPNIHRCPQEPQLLLSVRVLTQAPLQQVGASDLQTFPHSPQFVVLVERFTQEPSHMVFPMMRQAFDAVIPPGPSGINVPVAAVVVVTAAPVVVVAAVGSVVASAGRFVQVDALQNIPAGQVLPQIPQFAALDESS